MHSQHADILNDEKHIKQTDVDFMQISAKDRLPNQAEGSETLLAERHHINYVFSVIKSKIRELDTLHGVTDLPTVYNVHELSRKWVSAVVAAVEQMGKVKAQVTARSTSTKPAMS
eukprot:Clim_evm34s230 gene=Clim_evmTU34s230